MKNRKGFTLVELIVVLAILSILSSVAVFSIIGYIDKSRFDNNEQNAQSIYQAVQTALGRKKNSGEIEDWVENTLMKKGTQDPCDTGTPANNDMDSAGSILDKCFDASAFEGFDEKHASTGDSVHMRYVLTYQKDGSGDDNAVIMDLVGGYFYDTTILNATFSIEFDVEKTIGGDDRVHYSANTYAVFYDEKRIGWDSRAMNGSGSVVPWREYAYRSDKSLVGYYNGGNPNAMDSVYTPLVNKKIEFAELAMRNGEKLELSFSAMYDGKYLTGMGSGEGKDNYIHYTATIYDTASTDDITDDRWLADLVISEAYLTTGNPDGSSPVDYRKDLKFEAGAYGNGSVVCKSVGGTEMPVVYTTDYVTDDNSRHFVRYKASVETTAQVYVNTEGHEGFDYNLLSANDLTDGKFYRFPLTISYVIKEYSETERKEYISYSIALDAMMSRYAEYIKEKNTNTDKTLNYSITRLLMPETPDSPKNIRVSMTAAADAFTDSDLAKYNITDNCPDSEEVKAKRAYDDPVYYVAEDRYEYRDPQYADPEECAVRDIAGYAVCNTFFGDLGSGSFGTKNDYVIPDPEEGGVEKKYQRASITSFRHLYNMRYTTDYLSESGPVIYEIGRDLNWYRKTESGYTSDVEVYGYAENRLEGFSPAGKSGASVETPKLVSWPAIPELSSGQALIAKENTASMSATDKTSVIRNVQMRRQSFLAEDQAYGFICKNEGNISNLRCENFSLTWDSVTDGSEDTAKIPETVDYLVTHGVDSSDTKINYDDTKCRLQNGKMRNVPVGGLVGLQNGTLGQNGIDEEQNSIQMSNTVVLAGFWDGNVWRMPKLLRDPGNGIGGVAGMYSASATSEGIIETNGSFAIAGSQKVGGVFGTVRGAVRACLRTDSSADAPETVFTYPESIRAIVMSRDIAGGAIGYVQEGSFAQVDPAGDYRLTGDGEVIITPATDPVYAIDVALAENTYVWQFGHWNGESYEGTGGAVGQIKDYDGNRCLSVRCTNAGKILSGNADSGKYVGGAIGYMNGGAAGNMYICAVNKGLIGTVDGVNPLGKSRSAAVGIARMENFGTSADKFVLDVTNEGVIACNANKQNDTGIGAALGAYISADSCPEIVVRAVNRGTILAVDFSYSAGNVEERKKPGYGAGGAVGYLYALQNGSHIYALQETGATISVTGNNTGGAVGCIKGAAKGTAAKPVTIFADIKNSIDVKSTGNNVGGCVGYLRQLEDYTGVSARVMADSQITGYQNVGGVVGFNQFGGDAAGTKIALHGGDGPKEPTLTIRAQ
ncbi:MAG: type II secretion system GspH family protein, partial [Lachnospiraceae bacterium]|nr:type II secretion system GspH family protein [Lachnospiraceae bacterium]